MCNSMHIMSKRDWLEARLRACNLLLQNAFARHGPLQERDFLQMTLVTPVTFPEQLGSPKIIT